MFGEVEAMDESCTKFFGYKADESAERNQEAITSLVIASCDDMV